MNIEKQQGEQIDEDYFIKNAISCWLHHFPNHEWAPIYRELRQRESFNQTERPIATPRPARRRKPKV